MKIFAVCAVLFAAAVIGLTFFFRGLAKEIADFDEWEADFWDDPEVCSDMDCPCHWEDHQ